MLSKNSAYERIEEKSTSPALQLEKFYLLQRKLGELIGIANPSFNEVIYYESVFGENILLLACKEGLLEVVLWLKTLPHFSQLIIKRNEKNQSALIIALLYGHFGLVQMFSALSPVDPINELASYRNPHDGGNILITGIKGSNFNLKLFEFLLGIPEIRALVNESDNKRKTIIQYAYYKSYWDIVILLLENGASIKKLGKFHTEALLHNLAKCGSITNIERILKLSYFKALINQTDNEGLTPIVHAALNGHWQLALQLVKKGANILPLLDYRDLSEPEVNHNTLLMIAASKGSLEGVNFLLALPNGHSLLNQKNSSGQTALFFAFLYGHKTVAQRLFKAGEPIQNLINYKRPGLSSIVGDYQTILSLAVERRSRRGVLLLLSQPLILKIIDTPYQGKTPLVQAALQGNRAVVQALIDSGADINKLKNYRVHFKDIKNATVLMEISQRGYLELVAYLLSLPEFDVAHLSYTTSTGHNAYLCSILSGHFKIYESLKLKATQEMQCEKEHLKKLQAFLKKLDKQSLARCNTLIEKHRKTPITNLPVVLQNLKIPMQTFQWVEWEYKAKEILTLENFEIFSLLAYRDASNRNIFSILIINNKSEAVAYLLEFISQSADLLLIGDNFGQTPLFYAALYGRKDLVEIFKSYGASFEKEVVNYRRPDSDNTILIQCADAGLYYSLEYLLTIPEAKKLLSLRNRWNETALCIAILHGYTDIANRLQAEGASIQDEVANYLFPKSQQGFLIHALKRGTYEGLVYALGFPCIRETINYPDEQAQTALGIAVSHYLDNTVKLLLSYGANIHTHIKTGKYTYTLPQFCALPNSPRRMKISQIINAAFYLMTVCNDINVSNNIDDYIKMGASPHQTDSLGRTPLHLAVLSERPKIVWALLNYDADPLLKDKTQRTSLDYCFSYPLNSLPQAKVLFYLLIFFAIKARLTHKIDEAKSHVEKLFLKAQTLDNKLISSYLYLSIGLEIGKQEWSDIYTQEDVITTLKSVLEKPYSERAHYEISKRLYPAIAAPDQLESDEYDLKLSHAYLHILQAGNSEHVRRLRQDISDKLKEESVYFSRFNSEDHFNFIQLYEQYEKLKKEYLELTNEHSRLFAAYEGMNTENASIKKINESQGSSQSVASSLTMTSHDLATQIMLSMKTAQERMKSNLLGNQRINRFGIYTLINHNSGNIIGLLKKYNDLEEALNTLRFEHEELKKAYQKLEVENTMLHQTPTLTFQYGQAQIRSTIDSESRTTLKNTNF